MKKIILSSLVATLFITTLYAQDEKEEKKGLKKENLFTGGSVSLAFYNNTFLIGGNPVFGYSLANWIDLGLVINYNYTSYRDYQVFNDRLRQSVYGGGMFTRLYPVRFLFVQAQVEHNFIRQKYMLPNNGSISKYSSDANSFLIGAGYTTGREGRGGRPFYYLSVLADVSGNSNSPYLDGAGRIIPVIRGGIQVPLFQGGRQ